MACFALTRSANLRRSARLARGPVASFLACALIAVAYAEPATAQSVEHLFDGPTLERTTPHYRLFAQASEEDADAYASILEQCWPAFRDFFKSEPVAKDEKRLVVRVYQSLADFQRGTLDDHAAAPLRAAPAWYCARTETVYLHQLASAYLTRSILIYGACLQFHGLAKFKNLDLDWAWYLHGIGESFGVHAWDGKKLELARRPRICMSDYPTLAQRALGGRPASVESWTEQVLQDPAVRWCIVRFAQSGANGKYRPQFEKLALGLTGSKMSGEDFMRSLGHKKSIAHELAAWIEAEQFPFEALHGEWEERADGRVDARAGAQSFALCAARDKYRSVEGIVCNARDLDSTGAIVLSYADVENYTLGRIVPPLVMIDGVEGGKRARSSQLSFGRMEIDNVLVKARRDGTRVVLEADGKILGAVDVPPGRLGFAAFGKPVSFREMRAQ
jgi:hypothetical protein